MPNVISNSNKLKGHVLCGLLRRSLPIGTARLQRQVPKDLKKKALYQKQPIREFIRRAKLFERSFFKTEMVQNKGMSPSSSPQTL